MKTLPGMKILPDTDHHYMFLCGNESLTDSQLLNIVDDFLDHETFKHVKNRCISREIINLEHMKVVLFGKEIEDYGDFIDIVLIGCDRNTINSLCHDRNLLHDDEIGNVSIKKFDNELNSGGTSDYVMCIEYCEEIVAMREQLSRYSVGEIINEKPL